MTEEAVDLKRRRFLTATATVVGGVGVVFAAVPFVASLQPSARARAIGAPVEVDISKLEEGQMLVAQWRGQPVWILRRSQAALQALEELQDKLRDPDSAVAQQPEYAQNPHRSIKPEYLVVVGLCTHLGCAPTFIPLSAGQDMGPDWKGGFFCPCHGSRFDLAGRVYKAVPAPTNLVVPPHTYLTETRLLIGVDEGAAS